MKQQIIINKELANLIGKDFFYGTSKMTCTQILILESGKIQIMAHTGYSYPRENCDFVVATIAK